MEKKQRALTEAKNVKPIRLAAIDIGSNAIRMVIADLYRQGTQINIETIEKFRVQIRLGDDVFSKQVISKEKTDTAVEAFIEFSQHCTKLKAQKISAIGTSALRDAQNTADFTKAIQKASGIKIETISGLKEAQLVYRAIQYIVNMQGKNLLLIDIGGGSVELSTVADSKIIKTHSFQSGTIRSLLKPLDPKKTYENYFNKDTFHYETAVGTGGNFEAILKLILKLQEENKINPRHDPSSDHKFNIFEVTELQDIVKKMSIDDRIKKLKLRKDRADVIMPAIENVVAILNLAQCTEVLVPQVGLKDGILLDLFENY